MVEEVAVLEAAGFDRSAKRCGKHAAMMKAILDDYMSIPVSSVVEFKAHLELYNSALSCSALPQMIP